MLTQLRMQDLKGNVTAVGIKLDKASLNLDLTRVLKKWRDSSCL